MQTTRQSNKFTNNNRSTDKVLAIIEVLAYSKEPLRLIDIANELNYNSSTILRFLNSLEQNGYIYKDKETLKYQMTFKICDLAGHVSSNTSLVEVASDPVRELSKSLSECVCLAIEQNYSVVYVYVSDGPGQMLRTTQHIGFQAPMHCTGVGKVILSDFPENKIEEMVKLKGLTRYTENTLVTKEQLMAELETIRQQGYAYDNEECELGARCIAFPVRDFTGRVIAGLSITGPSGRMTDTFIDTYFQKMLDTVQTISYKLGLINSFLRYNKT